MLQGSSPRICTITKIWQIFLKCIELNILKLFQNSLWLLNVKLKLRYKYNCLQLLKFKGYMGNQLVDRDWDQRLQLA